MASESSNNEMNISLSMIKSAVRETNTYLSKLSNIFEELNFDLFGILGQRNLSGFIGEVFSHFLSRDTSDYTLNPHADGRPDLIDISTNAAIAHLQDDCYKYIDGKKVPIKELLAPFRYGGAEVKCTIGTHSATSKAEYKHDNGVEDFELGISRIKYIKGLTYWAHHQHSTNMIGLYYDYYRPVSGIPQLLTVFMPMFNRHDWNKVSVGDKDHKKTSNTSLNASGKKKLYASCVYMVNDPTYIEKFKKMGVKLGKMTFCQSCFF